MSRRGREAQEVRERAVRMGQEHRAEYPSEGAAITSIAGKLGVGTDALCQWLRRAAIDERERPGITTAERERIRERALAAGFQRHLAKPVAPPLLVAAVAEVAQHIDARGQ